MYPNVIRIVNESREKGINVALPTGKEEEEIVSVDYSSANRQLEQDNGHELHAIGRTWITQSSVRVS